MARIGLNTRENYSVLGTPHKTSFPRTFIYGEIGALEFKKSYLSYLRMIPNRFSAQPA